MGLNDGLPPPTRLVVPRPAVILLVDDEPDVLHAVADMLEHALIGVRVLRATSAKQGLAMLNNWDVDAIIADFKMSGMDGIEFLYIARQDHPGVPSAMLTAYADDPRLRHAAVAIGVRAFLSKASTPDEFLARVAALLMPDSAPAAPDAVAQPAGAPSQHP